MQAAPWSDASCALVRRMQAASDSRQAMDDLSVMLQMAGHSARGKRLSCIHIIPITQLYAVVSTLRLYCSLFTCPYVPAGKLAWATREDGEVWTDEDVAILLRHMNQPDYVQRCMAELMPPRNPDCIRKKMAQLPGYIPVDATESGT